MEMGSSFLRLGPSRYQPALQILKDHMPQPFQVIGSLTNASREGRQCQTFIVDKWPDFNIIITRPPETKLDIWRLDHAYSVFFRHPAMAAKRFLDQNKVINWKEPVTFAGLNTDASKAVSLAAARAGVALKESKKYSLMKLKRMAAPDKREYRLPRGFKIGPLLSSETQMVANSWSLGSDVPGLHAFVRYLIDNFVTLSVRHVGDNKAIGWYLEQPYGALGMLHVKEEYRGAGFARGLVKEASLLILEKGQTPYLYVDPTNTPSIRLHEQCGFEQILESEAVWARSRRPYAT